MIRVLQNLPQRIFKSYHGGVYWANRGQPVAESQRRRHQDRIITFQYPSPILGASFHTCRQCESIGGNHEENCDEEWKRNFKQKAEWDSFTTSSYGQEAVGWGSVIVLGLQLGRFIAKVTPGEERKKSDAGLVACIAQALPCSNSFGHVSSKRSILTEEEGRRGKRQNDSSSSAVVSDEWDYEPSDSRSSGLLKPTWMEASPSNSTPASTFASNLTFSTDSAANTHSTSSSSSSSSSSSESRTPSSTNDLTATFDQVTQWCWGQVNNIIGGHLMSEGDEEKGVHHFMLASDAGYSKGQYNLGMCYELGQGVLQDYVKAAVCFGRAAKQGHPQAQYKLGTYHLEGRGNVKQCQKTALTLITQAANAGVTQAQSYLGVYHMTNGKPDPHRAVMFLQEAAIKKDPEAQYHLGMCYEFGWGVETNQPRAAHLYHSAASKDHASSLYALGLFHEEGLGGLPENSHQARELFTKASSLGCEKATERLLEMDAWERDQIRRTHSFTSSSSSDSLIFWDRSSETESEIAELGQTLLSSCSDLSIDSSASSEESQHWGDILGHISENIHSSRSAPELTTTRRDQPSLGGDGDGAGVNSILHSLSLSLIFPELHNQRSEVRGQGDESDSQWTIDALGWVGRRDRDNKSSMNGGSGGTWGHSKVKFQLGGVDEDEDGLDWCEPLDTIAQRRLVTFRRAAAVV